MNYQRLVKELRKKLILSQEEFAKLLTYHICRIKSRQMHRSKFAK